MEQIYKYLKTIVDFSTHCGGTFNINGIQGVWTQTPNKLTITTEYQTVTMTKSQLEKKRFFYQLDLWGNDI